jgi:acyl-CoA reductase-like NAD-dependent aldehyde dehydrogenase
VCTSAERFYVLAPVFEEFVERLVEETRRPRLGDPLLATTDVGPMIAEVQRAKVERQLDQARGAGARVLAGGDRGGFERGWFLAPTVVVDVDDSMELLRTETFGPVAPVQRVGTVWINDPLTDNDAGPFGGTKMSGNARELGREGLESFRETKHVHLDGRANRKPWWYPYGQEG